MYLESPRPPQLEDTPVAAASLNQGCNNDVWCAHGLLVVFLMLLWLPNLLGVPLSSDIAGGLLESAALSLGFWLIWFALFKRASLAVWSASLLWFAFWPAEIYLRSQFRSPINPAFVGIVAESHSAEVLEFFASFGWWMVPAWLALFSLTAVVVRAVARTRLSWQHRSRWWVLATLVPVAPLLMLAFDQTGGAADTGAADAFAVQPVNPWAERLREVFPFDVPLSLVSYLQDQTRVAELRQRISKVRFTPEPTGAPPAEIIVLVIGESSRVDRWRLDGYARNTTPLLSDELNLFFLTDVVTHSTATRQSVPSIVARHPVLLPDGKINPNPEPSFLAALNEAGYATAWISNQASSGYFDTSSLFYARDATRTVFVNPTGYKSLGSYDEALLRPLELELARGGKSAVILHTMGSHFQYSHRYPKAFDRFRPSLDANSTVRSELDVTELSNAYDNTILYTDFVLSRVIAAVKRQHRPAAVVYVSDHGEDVREPGCSTVGLTRKTARSFRVPAFVWLSDELAQRRAVDVASLRHNLPKQWQSDFVFPTMLDLAGLKVADSSRPGVQKSVLLAPRGSSQVRWVSVAGNRTVDFDKAEARNACSIADGG